MLLSLNRLAAAGIASFFLIAGNNAFAQAKKPAPPQPAPAQPAPGQAAPAQPQQPQGPVKVDLVPTQNDWTKVCGRDQAANKDICYTTRDFSAQAGQPPVLALAIYDIKGEDTRIIRLLVPVGLMLRPGFRFVIDKGETQSGGFEICFPNGCFAEARVTGAIIDQTKKGSTLSVAVKNQVNNEITFVIPLAGFGKAFDGPPIDPKVLEEQQKKLQEELQKRAEEERKRLEAAKPDANKPDAAKTAPPAPASK
ncbi:MAG: invasion associated locus B family protein [Beijerinckiaceae bacterium]|nr:invasion associated locus B family protein [Beijerinckiaceae bacterium]